MARARRGARKQAARVSRCARGARTCRTPALRRGALGSRPTVVAPADVAQRGLRARWSLTARTGWTLARECECWLMQVGQ
eukprot:4845024-Pleurochrysis_carterae.AAC.1